MCLHTRAGYSMHLLSHQFSHYISFLYGGALLYLSMFSGFDLPKPIWELRKYLTMNKIKKNPGTVPYFRGDWSWNNFYSHSPPFRWIIQEGLLPVTRECKYMKNWLTICSSLPRIKWLLVGELAIPSWTAVDWDVKQQNKQTNKTPSEDKLPRVRPSEQDGLIYYPFDVDAVLILIRYAWKQLLRTYLTSLQLVTGTVWRR